MQAPETACLAGAPLEAGKSGSELFLAGEPRGIRRTKSNPLLRNLNQPNGETRREQASARWWVRADTAGQPPASERASSLQPVGSSPSDTLSTHYSYFYPVELTV